MKTVLKNSVMTSNFASSLKAKAGVSAVLAGGVQKRLTRDEQITSEASFLSLVNGGSFEPYYCFSIIEARDVGFAKQAWACSILCNGEGPDGRAPPDVTVTARDRALTPPCAPSVPRDRSHLPNGNRERLVPEMCVRVVESRE